MYAFAINHFGSNKKYLELEIFFLINLRKYTKYDIIYMYSINDTPDSFIKVIKKYCDILFPYDDNKVSYNIEFKSVYEHFNLLRTVNFIYGYKLTNYKKVCIIESDMIILKNIDDIFKLKTPSILINGPNILKNYKLTITDELLKKIDSNGGIMLFKPSIKKFNEYLKKIPYIIEKNYDYPNEVLFLHSNKVIYNLPYKYNVNAKEYEIKNYINKNNIENIKDYVVLLHFKVVIYKQINIIRDNYLEKLKIIKPILYYFIKKYKKEIYDKYNDEIVKIMNKL